MDINKVILIGRVGRAPEIKQFEEDSKVCNFSVATSETYKDGAGTKTKTEWHNVVAWNKLADLTMQYVPKGVRVYIEGKISTQVWEDKDGNKRETKRIIASVVNNLSKKGEESQPPAKEQSHESNNETSYHPPVEKEQPAYNEPLPDEDLPF